MSRVSKSLKNAKVGVFFFIVSIFVQFFTRKLFLDNLGNEFIGLETTLRSILSFLNLAELGIGTAIGFTLYKPIFDKNYLEINKIIALLGILYRKIGYAIFGVGFIISLFFPMMFDDTSFQLVLVYFVFYALLFSTLLSYFVNYHISLLGADQKGYIVQQYFQTFTIIRVVLQALVAVYLKDFYIYITLELVFSILYSIVVRYKIKKEYPWLKINSSQKAEIIREYPTIIKKIKQVFFHKMSSFVKNGTDNLLIAFLISIESVAFFGNYQLIFTKLGGLVKMAFAGTGSAVGNLIAENDQKNIKKVFWELVAIQFFIAGFFSIIIYNVMDSFILLWLEKEEYVLSNTILLLMIANFFMYQISSPIERFKNAYGLYSDTWAAVAEALINLGISFFFGRIYGIAGIMLGTLVSMLLIMVIWKPYFLYKNGFKKNVWLYWRGLLPIILVFCASALIVNYLIDFFVYDEQNSSFINWVMYATKTTVSVIIIYGSLMFIFIPGFKIFCLRIKNLIFKKLIKKP
ncbi:lipopolysaccharide biosynthesis protein [Winogradskyella ursingii]|uniref:lipopolysaccharide biosynthesis protein n=1 Tax=Winogradskyella ursingii TaxID=2686079 RepID=UPI0015C876A4|nr:sugar transporter [Winogradskyella ursingii]